MEGLCSSSEESSRSSSSGFLDGGKEGPRMRRGRGESLFGKEGPFMDGPCPPSEESSLISDSSGFSGGREGPRTRVGAVAAMTLRGGELGGS